MLYFADLKTVKRFLSTLMALLALSQKKNAVWEENTTSSDIFYLKW